MTSTVPLPALGHSRLPDGRSQFRVYAPRARQLAVVFEAGDRPALALTPEPPARPGARPGREIGHWSACCQAVPAGTRYRLEIDGQRLPDPASRLQPEGVHGPSEVVDVRRVESPGWRGVALADAVIYELHLGTFTPEGTLAAAQARLPHLQRLGVNVVELLPIAAFPGERNWGYDGAALFALHAAYGSYADLKAYIEAAHALGLAVILDVVYNHFGPEGNYTGAFAPYTQAAATPWGSAVNFDGPWNHGVRDFFAANLGHWLQDVGFDGVRMDAVSMVFDHSPVHVLREWTDLARAIGAAQGREVITIAEHLRNQAHVTARDGLGYDAQWNDDLNHALYACLTGETWRHYQNFGTVEDVVTALRDGFVLNGQRFDAYHGWCQGSDGRGTRGDEHVVHIQNHDQVGNRLQGDRLIASYGRDKALLAITAVMASPYVPMLWMGEEYGETAPFYFFEDFGDEGVIRGCREGRKADFAFGGAEPPDPHARSTFEASKLQWALAHSASGQSMLAVYRRLITLKRAGVIGPRERSQVRVSHALDAGPGLIRIETPASLTLLNFGAQACRLTLPEAGWRLDLATQGDAASARPGELAPWSAQVILKI